MRALRAALFVAVIATTQYPTTGLAQDGPVFDCVVKDLRPEYRSEAASLMSMSIPDDRIAERLAEELQAHLTGCMDIHGIEPDSVDGEAYQAFQASRIGREAILAWLGERGIPTAPIERALDIGPERKNPWIADRSFDAAQTRAVSAAYRAIGIDYDGLSDEVTRMIHFYAIASTSYWNERGVFLESPHGRIK